MFEFGIGSYKKEVTAILHTCFYGEVVRYLVVDGDLRKFDGFMLGDEKVLSKKMQSESDEEELYKIFNIHPGVLYCREYFDKALLQGAYLITVNGL